MKKVLIIGYFTPYRRGGSGRMFGLAKYLSSFGWHPIILTAPLEHTPDPLKCTIIEAPYFGDIYTPLRKIGGLFGLNTERSITEQLTARTHNHNEKKIIEKTRTLYQEIVGYPDTERLWKKPAIKKANTLLEREGVDAMISVWPHTSHCVAYELKKKFHVPWVVDFPDPWSENHDYAYGKIRKFFDKKLERKIGRSADVFTAASPSYAAKEEKIIGKRVETITLGYDPESLMQDSGVPPTHPLTITYTGTIYRHKQDPIKFFSALKNLIRDGSIEPADIRVNFYGPYYEWLEEAIKTLGLESIVSQCGMIAKKEALQKQQESHVLLLFCWEDSKEKGVYPLKLFEYLSSMRPILATGGSQDEDVKKIIAETRAGLYGINEDQIKKIFLEFYVKYKKNSTFPGQGEQKKIQQYSYQEMARKFATILNSLI